MLIPIGQGNKATGTRQDGRVEYMDGKRTIGSPPKLVTNRIPDYLKLFIEELDEVREKIALPEFERLWAIFPEVTGLRLKINEQEAGNQLTFPWSGAHASSYKVTIEPTKRAKLYSLTAAKEMEEALAQLLNALSETRGQLKRREAEMAAAIPVVSVEADGVHLAERLEATLRGTAEMLDCYGAGLYMLDENTTSLKLRAHHGLSDNALLKPSRPLEDAMADVEALSGNAVVIEDVKPSHWTVPEESLSAMCVPIASATTILGTLWMYSNTVRDFTPSEQNLAEITAGRLASDLERAVLTREVRVLREEQRKTGGQGTNDSATTKAAHLNAAISGNDSSMGLAFPNSSEAWSEGRLARFAPYIDGWDVADARTNARQLGDFSHWHIVNEKRVHLAIGTAHGPTDKRLSSIALQATHAAHTEHDPGVREIFDLCNQSQWASSAEGDASSMFHAVLDPTCGSLEYGLTGGVFAWILRPHGWEPLLGESSVIGVDCDIDVTIRRTMLMPGDILLALSTSSSSRSFDLENRMNQIAEKLLHNTHLMASELSDLAATQLQPLAQTNDSLAVLIARREEA